MSNLTKDDLIKKVERLEDDLKIARMAVKEGQQEIEDLKSKISGAEKKVEDYNSGFQKMQKSFEEHKQMLAVHVNHLAESLAREKSNADHYFKLWFKQYEAPEEE